MRIVELWRYPLKSAGGERLERAELSEAGIEGDRHWALQRLDTGKVLTARREPRMLFASARIEHGRVEVTLPDGHPATDDGFSAWLGYDVKMIEASGGGTVATYEIDLADNGADGFVWGENVATWNGPVGRFHDSTVSSVSIVSDATLGARDVRRFRTNIVVDGEGEDDLVGAVVRIGGATVKVSKQIDRCVMVTRPQPGLERDVSVLKAINADRKGFLSIGGLVLEPGPIAVGDAITALD